MPPEVLNPAEFINAAKAVNAAAVKWGAVADLILSWTLPATAIGGAFVGFLLGRMFGGKKES